MCIGDKVWKIEDCLPYYGSQSVKTGRPTNTSLETQTSIEPHLMSFYGLSFKVLVKPSQTTNNHESSDDEYLSTLVLKYVLKYCSCT